MKWGARGSYALCYSCVLLSVKLFCPYSDMSELRCLEEAITFLVYSKGVTEDSQFAIITLPKANPGTMWPSLFIGDPEGQRLIPGGTAPLYRLDESDPDETMAMCYK
eukprot:scaffold221944_cov15-Tisochrysis_lutea.AAC.1